VKDRPPAERQHELREALQRRRLSPTLDAADRVLAGSGAEGQSSLTDPLLLSGFAKGTAKILGLTPHTVSYYRRVRVVAHLGSGGGGVAAGIDGADRRGHRFLVSTIAAAR